MGFKQEGVPDMNVEITAAFALSGIVVLGSAFATGGCGGPAVPPPPPTQARLAGFCDDKSPCPGDAPCTDHECKPAVPALARSKNSARPPVAPSTLAARKSKVALPALVSA